MLCLGLAFLSKETGILLLIYIALFEGLFLAGGYAKADKHPREWAKRALLLSIASVIAIVITWVMLLSGSLIEGYGTRPFKNRSRCLWRHG